MRGNTLADEPGDSLTPSGRWQARYYDPTRRRRANFIRKTDAKAFLASMVMEKRQGTWIAATIRYIVDSSGNALGQQATPAGGPTDPPTYDAVDPRGDVVQVLDSGANVLSTYGYDPFGNAVADQDSAAAVSSSPTGSALQFQGPQKDPTTGEYELGPRLYSPQIDRFVGADLYAASEAGLATQEDPLTGNSYLYAGANPAGLIDNGYGPSYSTSEPSYCIAPPEGLECKATDDTYSYERQAQADVVTATGGKPERTFDVPFFKNNRKVDVYVEGIGLIIEVKIGRVNNGAFVQTEYRRDAFLLGTGGLPPARPVTSARWEFFPNRNSQTGPDGTLLDNLLALKIQVYVYYNRNPKRGRLSRIVTGIADAGTAIWGAAKSINSDCPEGSCLGG